MHPVATLMPPRMERSQSPLGACSSTGPLERVLTATGFTPLLVNLESLTSKPSAGGGSKDCVAWKVEKAVHYFVHADKVTTHSSTG